jgi:hypothetical protein
LALSRRPNIPPAQLPAILLNHPHPHGTYHGNAFEGDNSSQVDNLTPIFTWPSQQICTYLSTGEQIGTWRTRSQDTPSGEGAAPQKVLLAPHQSILGLILGKMRLGGRNQNHVNKGAKNGGLTLAPCPTAHAPSPTARPEDTELSQSIRWLEHVSTPPTVLTF